MLIYCFIDFNALSFNFKELVPNVLKEDFADPVKELLLKVVEDSPTIRE